MAAPETDWLESAWRAHVGAKPKTTLGPRKCDHCGVEKQVMMTMAPGWNGEAWWLCVPCYREGYPPPKKE